MHLIWFVYIRNGMEVGSGVSSLIIYLYPDDQIMNVGEDCLSKEITDCWNALVEVS